MPAPANLVHETSTTTGTGNLTLVNVNGKNNFNDAFGTGGSDVFDYFISNQSAAEWERGTGHMSDATTLVRDTVIQSTNSNNAVSFSAGTKDVTNDVPAGNQVRAEAAITDHAVVRGNGGAAGVQSSGVTIDDSNNVAGVVNLTQTGYHDLTEISEPASPAANVARLFPYDDGGTTRLAYKDSGGDVYSLGGRGTIIYADDRGTVGDDSTDDGPDLQTILDEADGAVVRLTPGKTYRIATAVVTSGKSWTLDARGAKIHFDANVNGITAIADIDNLQSVSSISGADVTVADGSAFAVGDHVRVISEDTPTNARDVSSGNTYKSGEPGIVESISSNVLTLESSLIHGASMTTTPRIYRMPLEEQVQIIGGEWYYTEGHDATPWTGTTIILIGLISPRVEGVRITRGYNSGISLIGTQHAYIAGPRIERLTDNTGNSQFGYGVADAGYNTTIVGISGGSVRHLVTTNPLAPAAETTSETQLQRYGHCRGLRVLGGTCMGASSVAFDTHHSTEDVLFAGLYAENCTYAVQIRAQKARVIDVEGRNIVNGIVRVASDSTDTPATEAGWAADVYIDNIFGNADQLLVVARAKDVHLGRAKATLTSWKAIESIDGEVFLHDDIDLTIADTASTHAGRGVLDSDDVEASFTPSIEQVSGRLKVAGSGSSGSTTFAAANSDASSVILRNSEFVFPNGSVGPMLITANSGTIAADLKFDISGSAETGMTHTSGSNISANIESNDGLHDALNLRRKAREPLKWIAAGTPNTATIASGVITATASFMTIDTESAAATDDLDTINEGCNGDILILRTNNSARDIVLKNGTGNITCGFDRTLASISDRIVLMNTNGTAWIMIGFFSNAGSGGTVTQASSRTTGVTLNALTGAITLVSAAGSTTFASFTVTNSFVAVGDNVVCVQRSGTDLYEIHVTAVSAGSFRVTFRTTGGTTTEQPVFNFSVIKQSSV